MKLSLLLQSLDKYKLDYRVIGDTNKEVTGISDDTRKIKKGNLFVAINGLHYRADRLIPIAINKKASVIVCEKIIKPLVNITYIEVENSRKALSYISSAWFGYPSEKLKVIGITGTKGKTTTAHVLYELLKKSGKNVGVVTSISAKIKEEEIDTGLHVTNPEPLLLQQILSRMVEENIEYAILEVTSHGIDQERIAGIKFNIGIFTNLAKEHLDYHKNFAAYRRAKFKLFENSNICILNKDDPSYSYLSNHLHSKKVVTYSILKNSHYKVINIKHGEFTEFSLKGKNQIIFKTTLVGEFNLYNVTAAIVCADIIGIPDKLISENLIAIKSPQGRLQKINNKRGFDIYIDFAHTPDSLESVLAYLRKVTSGKLISVFGSAGERDKLKRPLMGVISAKYADISVITAEDPRSEDVVKIIDSIANGAIAGGAIMINNIDHNCLSLSNISRQKRKHFIIKIPERGEAIYYAINKFAQNKDTVVICGKGHEKSMAYDRIEYPWSDIRAVEFALKGEIKTIKREFVDTNK